ncbi:hypothetical protein NUU61_008292 [Penicillium alfredii]|uniref:Uncharacterized protein n=1 Tax=Penicillium alfredii TaxID=1506179 RepID=A0A9W9JZ95_9EURO|nr:uncharacterized protein NUU61_008292 [Penicillium alfredii]KAJ5086985.1 hypothetical protein NUU61_008292 [Penicillium alfredii]
MSSYQPTSKPSSRRQVNSSESSEASQASSSQYSWGSSTGSSNLSPGDALSESVDPTIHPTTLIHAHRLDAPAKLEDLAQKISLIKELLDQRLPPLSTPVSQYLLVVHIPKPLFSDIESQPNIFKGVRATLFPNRHQVLYKIMPDEQHDQIIAFFHDGLGKKLGDMGLSSFGGDFLFRNSTRTRGLSNSKEPDLWFGPYNVNVNGGGRGRYPSLVLEVGFSESSSQLRNDAHWWFTNSSEQTRLVVLIHANRGSSSGDNSSPWAVDIEVWTEVPNPSSHQTRDRPTNSLKCTQSARVKDGSVTGAPLILDFETLMRRPPVNPLEGNVVLDAGWIRIVCAEVGP